MAHGRLVRRRPDAHSHSHSKSSPADAYSRPDSDSRADSATESRLRLQRDSNVDPDRDLHGRPARESERLHLRSQVVDSKPEPGDQLRRRWPMEADRPLRPAGSEPESGQWVCNSCESNAVQPDVPEPQSVLYLSGPCKCSRDLP